MRPLSLLRAESREARQVHGLGSPAGADDGALGGPATAYIYDWNLLPMSQALWLRELET